MKRLKQSRSLPSLLATTVLVFAVAVTSPANSQEEKPDRPPNQENSKAATEGKPRKPAGGLWTCPMHAQVQQAERGKCPICSMHLIWLKHKESDSLMSLDRMLALALRHNPDVRADQARVIAAEADLDRTRLEVVQTIIAYRQRWKEQNTAVSARADDLERVLLRSAKHDDLSGERADLVAEARRLLAFERARLSEIEAEIPFLLGRSEVAQADTAVGPEAVIIQEVLIPRIEQLVKVMVIEFRSGNAALSDVQPWPQRLAELKIRIATTKGERIAVIESHLELLKSIAKMTAAQYRAGEVSQGGALAAEVHLAEAELWLVEVSESDR